MTQYADPPPNVIALLQKKLGRRPTVVEECDAVFDALLDATNGRPKALTREDMVDPPPNVNERILEQRRRRQK